MEKHRKRSSSLGFGLLELLLVILIISFFYWKLGPHVTWSGLKDKNLRREFEQEKIDTTTAASTVQSVQKRLAEIQATAAANSQKERKENGF